MIYFYSTNLDTMRFIIKCKNKKSFCNKIKLFKRLKLGQIIKIKYFFFFKNLIHSQTFTGICLKKKKNGWFSSFVLRTSFKGISVEKIFFIFSSLLFSMSFGLVYSKKIRLAKPYFLRLIRKKYYKMGVA